MEVMIDIESAHNISGGLIFDIGAVVFHDGKEVATYSSTLNFLESSKDGFLMSSDTLEWWEKQGGIPDQYLKSEVSNVRVLSELCRFCMYHRNGMTMESFTGFWSRGHMDYPMLEAYLHFYGFPIPWRHYERKEHRTAIAELGGTHDKSKTVHRALEDAQAQVVSLVEARKPHIDNIPASEAQSELSLVVDTFAGRMRAIQSVLEPYNARGDSDRIMELVSKIEDALQGTITS